LAERAAGFVGVYQQYDPASDEAGVEGAQQVARGGVVARTGDDDLARVGQVKLASREHGRQRRRHAGQARSESAQSALGGSAKIGPAGELGQPQQIENRDGITARFGAIVIFLQAQDEARIAGR